MTPNDAVQGLLTSLQPKSHCAVWMTGEQLVVAVDPAGPDVIVPETYQGFKVVRVPWSRSAPVVLTDKPLDPNTTQGLAQFDRTLAVAVDEINKAPPMADADKGMKLPTFAGLATAFGKLESSLEQRGQRILNRIEQTEARGASLEAKAIGHLEATEAKIDQYGKYFDEAEKAMGGNGMPVDDPISKDASNASQGS